MNTAKTTARPSADLDATDELPVLDPAAYEAEVLSREPAGPTGSRATATESDPSAPPVAESDVMLAVERWIAQKTEELRGHHDELSLAQSERTAAVARTDALSRELAETRGLLEQRSVELQGLQRTHEALSADRQRVARGLSELETRLRDSEARARDAQHTLEAQSHTHAELTQRLQRETGARERLAAEVNSLQTELASCVESLHSRESYRAIYESTLQELDAELAAAKLQTAEQEARAERLDAELQSRERRLQTALQERDEARHLHDTQTTQHAAERDEGERRRNGLESRLAELTAEHARACAQHLAMEAALTAERQRAHAEAHANGTAMERLRELESAMASRQAELSNTNLEIERNRTLLADLTAALLRSQTMLCDRGRLLEEREAAASAMAATHAEQAAQMTMLRGQIEELTVRLAAPEAQRRALEERVAALAKEVAESNARLRRLESTNADLRATVGQLDTLLAERDAELQRATQIASLNAHALGRVQSSIDELGRTLTAPDDASTQAQVSILTRIDGGQNHSVVLRGRTTIGRDRDNDVSLAMRSVSRHHAVLIPAFRTAFVQDLMSTNGVLVSQHRVRCARLEHGDLIAFGEAQFRYTVTPAPAGVVSTGPTTCSSTRAPLKHAS